MDSAAPISPSVIRNIVQINPTADALGFAAAGFAAEARVLRLSELGPDRLMVRMLPPAGTDIRIWLPDRTVLAQGPEAVMPLLDNLRSCRLAVVHRVDHPARVASLLDRMGADAICLSPQVSAAWMPDLTRNGLAACDLGFDIAACGLTGLRLFANEIGAAALTAGFLTLDGARRRRLRETERVYDVEDFVPCHGLYPNERDDWGRWAWTGPETIATFLAPMHGGARARLTLFFFANKRPLDAANLRVLVNGRSFPCRYVPDELKIEIAVEGLGDAAFARFDLLQAAMVPTEDHSRRLGFALHKLKVETEL
ncbi:hypothetical protein [Acidisoma silvae]|uniref:Uncharacterized protein n=1 Tax=Acidisoma silvae TaxID=2802396 RepID=A0A964DWW3_9PROT|nr:hypothetical protein [Acidisoma silvae]MCB8873630.1 hypothetical protein [Acidisoma silvae]